MVHFFLIFLLNDQILSSSLLSTSDSGSLLDRFRPPSSILAGTTLAIRKIMEEPQLNSGDTEGQTDYSDITLRLLDISDADDFMVWATDEKACEYLSWNSDKYASKETVVNHIIEYIIPHPWYRAICLGGRAVGDISVYPNTGRDSCRAEIGYVVGSKYWGKGIATRAVKMAVSTIFIDWPHLQRLEALVDVDNLASQKVLEKVGFVREGVMRNYMMHKGKVIDMVMFSIIPSDPLLQHLL